MIPIRFGTPSPDLYGVFHPSTQRSSAPRALLLCNPFGQEAVRIHRLYRVLAERLAREGIACLRFDYHASGDSLGEDEEADLDRWVSDILAADALLRQRAGTQDITWVAPRLASALAARASSAARQAPQRLVLWEPVSDGSAYLQELMDAHQQTMATLPDKGEQAGETEIIGFGVSPTLLQQIRAIGPHDYSGLQATETIVLSRSTGDHLPLDAARVDHRSLSIDFDWLSEEALNTALVPSEAVNTLCDIMEGATHG